MSQLFDKTAKSAHRHRVVAALLGVLAASGTAATVYATTSPDFSLSAQPPSQTIDSGQSTSYVVSISPSNEFTGAVTLAAGSLPKGISSSWQVGTTTTSGTSVTVPAGSGTRDATLTIGGGQPTAGTYNPTVTGTSGSLKHAVTLTLVVQNQNAANFTLSLSPSNLTPLQGPSNPTSTVSIARTSWTGSVSLGPVAGVPAGATATVNPSSTTSSSATLTITTASSTPPGVYTLVLPGSAVLSGKTASTRYAAFTLTVPQPGSFPVAGNLASALTLGNGGTESLDLAITNPYSTPLTVSNIAVTLASIKLAPGASGTCNQTGVNSPNFKIVNLAPGYTVTVPKNSTWKLSELGAHEKPTVTWLDQPWRQNGCLGVTLSFSYTASGTY